MIKAFVHGLMGVMVSVFFALFSCISLAQEVGSFSLQELKPHPRLFLTTERLKNIKSSINSDSYAQAVFSKLMKEASLIPHETTVGSSERIPGKSLPSREIQRRVVLLSGLYLITGDQNMAEQATREMLAASNLKNWDPQQFLEVSEITFALAVGYDWLYDVLSAKDKTIIQTAILQKGLYEGLTDFRNNGWWTKADFNWNIVCNAGLVIGALAIMENNTEIANDILQRASLSLQVALKTFGPDGGWKEGPMYWRYASRYLVYYLDGLKTALDIDSEITRQAGIAGTGLFRLHAMGPSGKPFNFADSNERVGPAPQMFWFAHTFQMGAFAEAERAWTKNISEIFHLIWSALDIPKAHQMDLNRLFSGINTAVMRSSWDNDSFYAALKGSDNSAFSHAHLDAGSFVIDAMGQRWISELPPPSYFLPEVFGDKRWGSYRLGTKGHNTLLLNGEGQYLSAPSEIVAFEPNQDTPFAILDLTAPYRKRIRSLLRGIFMNSTGVLVQDEIASSEPVSMTWRAHTSATVTLNGNSAVLEQGGKKMRMQILSPETASLQISSIPVEQPEDVAAEEGIQFKVIEFNVPRSTGTIHIAVAFSRFEEPSFIQPAASLRKLVESNAGKQ